MRVFDRANSRNSTVVSDYPFEDNPAFDFVLFKFVGVRGLALVDRSWFTIEIT